MRRNKIIRTLFIAVITVMCLCFKISASAEIVGDGGTGTIGGEQTYLGDNQGVIIGDGQQEQDQQEQPPSEQPSVQSVQPKAAEPMQHDAKQKVITPSNRAEDDIKEDQEQETSLKEDSEEKKEISVNTIPEEKKEMSINIIPEEKEKISEKTEISELPDEIVTKPEQESFSDPEFNVKKEINARIALVVGYSIAIVIFVLVQFMISPWLYYMSPDLQYRFLSPVLLHKCKDGYTADIGRLIKRTESTSFRLVFRNPLFLNRNTDKRIVIDIDGLMSEYQIEKEIKLEV